jgi:HlyD family secretion protein
LKAGEQHMANVRPRTVRRATAAFLMLAVCGCRGSHDPATPIADSPATEEAHVVVYTQPAERRAIAQTVSALGRCEALPDKLALLAPAVEGQVQTLLVQQGQRITAGQPIIQLDSTLAQADMAEQQAARDSLVAALTLLKSLPRVEEQEASKLAIETAAIAVARAQAVVERLQPLKARGEVAEQQMFEAEQAVKEARIQQQAAEAHYSLLMLGPRPEAVAEAQAKIAAAEQAVKASQAKLELHTIRAPIDGVLESVTCRPGQMVAIGTSIGEIVDDRQVLASAWLPVRDGRLVRDGQSAYVRIASANAAAVAAPQQTQTEVAGCVVFVGRVADAQTGNIPVRVLVDNPQDELLVGQTLAMRIRVDESAPTLAIPVAAIHDEGEGPGVTVVRDGKTVVLHPQLGTPGSGWVAVSNTDLQAGEPVIVQGAYNLPEGTSVTVSATEPGGDEQR